MNRISSDTGRFAKAKVEPAFEAKEFSTADGILNVLVAKIKLDGTRVLLGSAMCLVVAVGARLVATGMRLRKRASTPRP
jgi:hypothetical protein